VFFIALVPAVFALQFNFPILLALSGALDAHGRWAGIAAPLITSGFAWAAIVAGLIVEHFGMEALASVNVVGMALCALLLWPATSDHVPPLDASPAHG
jgi:predicted MFS family arabinose efflux permease